MESGLVHLKAELLRKKAEASKHKVPIEGAKIGKLKALPKENSKSQNSKSFTTKESNELFDEDKLEKSRKALEQKSLLYDQLKDGTKVLEDDELNEKYLIDFQEKINRNVVEAKKLCEQETKEKSNFEDYKAKSDTEEWVEYTDEFGRHRVCQKRDLPQLSNEKRDLPQLSNEDQNEISTSKSTVSQDLHKSLLSESHSKWEKVGEETRNKEKVHYQDVLFNEARAHGTGFMGFSRDEATRAAQQQHLRDLSKATGDAQKLKERERKVRNDAMARRLVKVRERKRLKMGLPIKDESLQTPPVSDEESESIEQPPNDLPSPAPKSLDAAASVREWDLGKEGVLLSQAQWIQDRRKRRQEEFAPPQIYDTEAGSSSNTTSTSNVVTNAAVSSPPGRRAEIAPPPSFEYFGPSVKSHKIFNRSKFDMESSITKGLANLRKESGN